MDRKSRNTRDKRAVFSAARCGDIKSVELWLMGAGEESRNLMNEAIKAAIVNKHNDIAELLSQEIDREEGIVVSKACCMREESILFKNGADKFAVFYTSLRDRRLWITKRLSKIFWFDKETVENAVNIAAEYGRIDILRLYRNIEHCCWSSAIRCAARNGRYKCVAYIKSLFPFSQRSLEIVAQDAAKNGFVKIIQLCKKWGVCNFDKAMCDAARNGHNECVTLIRSWGVKEYTLSCALCAAITSGHVAVAEALVPSVNVTGSLIRDALCCASREGHVDMVNKCKSLGFEYPDGLLLEAAKYGHENVVEACERWSVSDAEINMAAHMAADRGHYSIVEIFRRWEVVCDSMESEDNDITETCEDGESVGESCANVVCFQTKTMRILMQDLEEKRKEIANILQAHDFAFQ